MDTTNTHTTNTMKHYLEFISCKDLQKNELFLMLKCDENEGKILQYMANAITLQGENDFVVHTLLAQVFPYKGRNVKGQYLAYLPHIRNLIELGWVNQNTFLQPKSTGIALLELYNETICLSHAFLRLLEDGALNVDLPEVTAYEDHLSYLKDRFLHIDLLRKISHLRFSNKQNTHSLVNATHRIKLLEETINARLALTHKEIGVVKLIKEHHLDSKEQIIFFAILKEEYAGNEDEGMCDMNALLELISNDEYEKISQRSLLDENSTLMRKGLIDYDDVLNAFGNLSRSFYIPERILQSIIHPNTKKKQTKISLESMLKEQDIFELVEPKYDIKDIVLETQTKERLYTLLAQMDKKVAHLLHLWGIRDKKKGMSAKILLYGAPGTGKTITALALAKSLKKAILSFDCSKILSMYVGESEKNVRKIFDSYKDICKKTKNEPLLLLDEADQFLSTRGSSGNSADKMHNQMQNIFLEQIERFEGILIATTNLLENVDSAFSRRFEHKIAFKRPNKTQREALWLKYLPKNATFEHLSKEQLAKALCEYDLSGGQIALIVKNTAYKVATKPSPVFTQEDFITHIKAELSGNFDNAKSMGFGR